MPPKIQTPLLDSRQGLNTSVPDESSDVVFRTFQDVRTDQGKFRRRYGCVRVAHITSDDTILDLDGTNDKITFPYNASQFGFHLMPKWTIEGISICDSLSSQCTLLEKGASGAAFVLYLDSTSSGRVVAEVKDSGGNVTTLTRTAIAASTKIDWRLSWDGTTLTLDVNGSTTTGTTTTGILATDTSILTVGATTAGTNFDGRIERVSVFSTVKSRGQDSRSRLWLSRSPSVLFDAVFNTTDFIRDRSRFESIGTVTGSPATTATLLTNNPVPIQAIAHDQSNQGDRKGYIVGAGKVYPTTVT